MIRTLVVDDIRTFTFPATYARTSDDALALLEGQQWDAVWLDHDLGGSDTTMRVVDWLIQEALETLHPVPVVVIHTQNPVGRANIYRALHRYPSRVLHVDPSEYMFKES